jgi:hypothetical protein
VNGTASLAGTLQAGVEDVSQISPSTSFAVLTAAQITGQFSNVASGGRVDVYSAFDSFGKPLGDPVGTFLVIYDATSLVLSDFEPVGGAPTRRRAVSPHGDQ